MRILIVTTLFPNPYQPGRAVWNQHQFGRLAQFNPVEIISPIAWTDELKGRWRRTARIEPARTCAASGIRIHHPRFVFVPRLIGSHGSAYLRSAKHCFRSVVADFAPDLVLASWAYPDGWAAVHLAHDAGLPAIVMVHGCDVLALSRYPARRAKTIEALTTAEGIVAVSRHLAEAVAQLGVERRRISIVYHGIDRDLFHPGPAASARTRLALADPRPLILFVGNLEPVKGLETLIAACNDLKHQARPFQCVMIGEGSMRSVLQRQIRRSGLDGDVRLLGSVPHRELPDWYRAAQVFVLPSRSEGLPCVLLEALACGTPWVASSVGGIPELARLGANRLVPAGDVRRLAAALGYFLAQDREELNSDGGQPGISWEASAQALHESLAKLAWSHPRTIRVELAPQLV